MPGKWKVSQVAIERATWFLLRVVLCFAGQVVYGTQLIGYNAQQNHETSRVTKDEHKNEKETAATGTESTGARSL
jgi:hypothetical protein